MTKAKTIIWIFLFSILMLLTMGIGIFALSSSELSSNAGVYYTATNPVISKEKFQSAFLDFQDDSDGGITSIIFDYYDPDTAAFYSPDGGETKIDFRTINESCKRDVSEVSDGSIIAYFYENGMYVISKETITFPKNCSSFFNTLPPQEGRPLHNTDAGKNDLHTVKKLLFKNVDTSKVESMYGMFFKMDQLEELDISKFDTPSVKNIAAMFLRCESLKEIDISHFDTSKVTESFHLLRFCKSLTYANLSGLDFSSVGVDGISCMFFECRALITANLTGIKTGNIKKFAAMFVNCENLTSIIGLNGLDTSSATNMSAMFHGCRAFTSLDLRNFNTARVTDMHQMFLNCRSLKTLDISTWNTSMLKKTAYMFSGCVALDTIYIGREWSTKNVTKEKFTTVSFGEVEGDHSMFGSCISIPTWNENKVGGVAVIDSTYAYAGYSSTTKKYGYLTLKTN